MASANKPPNVPHVMYNTRSQNMGGVFLQSDGHSGIPDVPGTFTGRATWWYGQVDGNQSAGNIGVVMTDPWGEGASVLSGGHGIVQVTMDYTLVFTETHVTYNVTAYIGGQLVFRVSGLTRPIAPDTTGIPLPFAPVFASPVSGTFAIEMNNVDDHDWDEPNSGLTYWIQRGLELEQPLQEFTLTPGEPAVFNNSFRWDFGDNRTDLHEASWDIIITKPGGEQVSTLSGTGRTIEASWDTSGIEGPFRLKPKGQDAPDGGTPIYAYKIITRALAYKPSRENWAMGATETGPVVVIPYDDVFYEVSTTGKTPELNILNITLNPDHPFQNPGDSVELTADIITVGLGDVSENDVEWWVDLIGPDGDVVGDPLATGTGYDVLAVWNGTVGGTPVEDPTSYSFKIRASTCGAEALPQARNVRAQTENCLTAQAEVAMGAPLLEIFPPNGASLASSNDKADSLSSQGFSRLSRVNKVPEWKIRLSGLQFEGTPPSTLTVNLETSEGSNSKSVTLSGPDSRGAYEGLVTVSEIVADNPEGTGSDYTHYDIPAGYDSEDIRTFYQAFSDTVKALESLSLGLSQPFYPYGPNARRLGTLSYLYPEADGASKSVPEGMALASRANFTSFGFEEVTATYTPEGVVPKNLNRPLKALIKTQHRAPLVTAMVHGGDDGKIDLAFVDGSGARSTDPFSPASLPADIKHLKTLILASCNVLDVYDYNNVRVGSKRHPHRTSPDDPVSLRTAPGLQWHTKTRWTGGQGGTILLGYNYPVPRGVARDALEKYFLVLDALKGKVAAEELQQQAWLRANHLVLGKLGYDACALDKNWYYYISYNRYNDDTPTKFVRLPLANLATILPSSYNDYVDGVPSPSNGSEQIELLNVEVRQ